ncbi:ribonuclease Z [Aliikangiella marina]|uniref:Ribonuclease Z n=1 Tax=Aliikangiella marina TaxID=1712262 RepID=A0A545TCL8_9GAMM|nr:ribonuclease Z [Aliikangiella marina]TQV74949.1 ribonuclease Z [Aliikangiella marina]
MKITFLGTSSGTPSKTRNVSGIAIATESKKDWILIDCGEGTQHQIQHTKLSLKKLSTICITHIHGDHCYGLPGLLASAAMSGKDTPLELVAPKPIQSFIESVIKTTDLHLGFKINFHDVTKVEKLLISNEIEIRTVALSHRVPSYAYIFEQTSFKYKLDLKKLEQKQIPRGPSWGKIQSGQDIVLASGETCLADDFLIVEETSKKIIVCGDNDDPRLLNIEASDADLVIHEATYTKEIAEKVGTGPQHSDAERVACFAQSIGLPNLVLTHFSPRYHDEIGRPGSILDIENEARLHYDGNLYLAKDFDIFGFDKNNRLILEDDND